MREADNSLVVVAEIGRTSLRYISHRVARREIGAASADAYRGIIWLFASSIGPETPLTKIKRRHVEDWVATADVKPSTKRHRLSVLRTFFDWCVNEGLIRSNPSAGIKPARMPRYLPRALNVEQVSATIEEAPNSRARLILILMCQEGLRAIEVSRLQFGDLDVVNRTIFVTGKGSHERLLPLSDETWEALTLYLLDHPARSGSLIRSFNQPLQGISARYVSVLASRWLHGAGVDATGHALRHTAATDVLKAGAALLDVRDMLGHASLATTQRYLPVAGVADLRGVMAGRSYGRSAGRIGGRPIREGDYGAAAADHHAEAG